MFKFSYLGRDFQIDYKKDYDYLDTSILNKLGVWEDVPGHLDDPTLHITGKTKQEALFILKEKLKQIRDVLYQLYSGEAEAPDEPEDIFDYIEWIIDNHLDFKDGEFVVKVD